MVCSLKSEVFWPTLMTFFDFCRCSAGKRQTFHDIPPLALQVSPMASRMSVRIRGCCWAFQLHRTCLALVCSLATCLKGWNGLKRVETSDAVIKTPNCLWHPSTAFGRTTTATPFCTIGVAFAQNIWRPPRLSTIASAKQVDEGRNRDLGGSNPIPLWLGLYV